MYKLCKTEQSAQRQRQLETGLLDAMKTLPEKYRISLYLYYYEEYSAREIAEVMGVSESAVGQYLTRGRRKLRTIITDEERRVAL